MATNDEVALTVLWRGLRRCLLSVRLAFGGMLQRQWPVPQTATALAPAPTTNQSALRCRRCQNAPPLAVVIASRSLVTAANFAALSVESCLAAASWAWQDRQSWTKSKSGFRSAAGICAEGASGRSCWFAGVAAPQGIQARANLPVRSLWQRAEQAEGTLSSRRMQTFQVAQFPAGQSPAALRTRRCAPV